MSAEDEYHVYVLQKIRTGEASVAADDVVPHEDVMRELAEWIEAS